MITYKLLSKIWKKEIKEIEEKTLTILGPAFPLIPKIRLIKRRLYLIAMSNKEDFIIWKNMWYHLLTKKEQIFLEKILKNKEREKNKEPD